MVIGSRLGARNVVMDGEYLICDTGVYAITMSVEVNGEFELEIAHVSLHRHGRLFQAVDQRVGVGS